MQFAIKVALFAALFAALAAGRAKRATYRANDHLNVDNFQASCDPKTKMCTYQFSLFSPRNFGTDKGDNQCSKTIAADGAGQLPEVFDGTCTGPDKHAVFFVTKNGDGSGFTLTAMSSTSGNNGKWSTSIAARTLKLDQLPTDPSTGAQSYTGDKQFFLESNDT